MTSKHAVNRFSEWCNGRAWIFQPVDGSNDFGKDGYVDITDEDGRLTGELFSVQIKGGESWSAAHGYRIPVSGHREVWMHSMVPVIGIVHDPRDGGLRWVNLTAALREEPDRVSVPVLQDADLEDIAQLQKLVESVQTTSRPGLPEGLGSESDDEQEAAVWDCFAMARRNVEAMAAVRRSFLALGARGRHAGLVALAYCTPHPDAVWTSSNTLPEPIRASIRRLMRWRVPEVWQLLELIEPETAFERGSIGQCVFMVLVEDKDCRELARRTALAAIAVDPMVASWAAALYLYLAGDEAPGEWAQLCTERPEFADIHHADHFEAVLRDFGYVDIG